MMTAAEARERLKKITQSRIEREEREAQRKVTAKQLHEVNLLIHTLPVELSLVYQRINEAIDKESTWTKVYESSGEDAKFLATEIEKVLIGAGYKVYRDSSMDEAFDGSMKTTYWVTADWLNEV